MVLLIDGNYILYRNTFALAKDRVLYGNLEDSLHNAVSSYAKWFPFKKVHFISDGLSNWRKMVYPEYKATRSKSDDIDWEFVHITYDNFKKTPSQRYDVLENELLEGDDWIAYLTKYYNKRGESVLIISNDGDIPQLLIDGKDYINIMVNENTLHNKIFINEHYRTWLANFNKKIGLPGLFDDDVSEDLKTYDFIKKLLSERQIKDMNPSRVLFEKIIGGDKGDNVKSVYIKNNRGIGVKTAEKIYNLFVEYFGEPSFDDSCFDKMTDMVIEQKKLTQEHFDEIKSNIILNNKLVNLQNLPNKVVEKIHEKYKVTDL